MDSLTLPDLTELAAQAWARAGLSPHEQAARLIRLHTPLGADLLLAEDLDTWEAVLPQNGPSVPALAGRLGVATSACRWSPGSAHFVHDAARAGTRMVLHALCADAALDAPSLVGLPALVELVCQDDGLRPWHGHVAAAAWLGADSGFARLRLVVEPWLAWLAQGQDARLHQALTVPELIDTVFSRRSGQALPNGASLAPAWRWALSEPEAYPQRSLCAQAHESDLAFVLRLMREEGLVAWWEHAADAASPTLGQHTLVIADHAGALPASEQATVRFTASDHTLGEDSLTLLADTRRVTASRVALSSRDHRSGDAWALDHRPVDAIVDAPSDMSAQPPDHALVDHSGAYAYPTLIHGGRRAEVQAQSHRAAAVRSVARGPWRRCRAGTWFTLTGHPRHGPSPGEDPAAGDFVVLAARHRARNNLAADERARVWALDQVLAQAFGETGEGEADAVARAALAGEPSRHPDAEQRLHEAALLLQPLDAPLHLRLEASPSDDLFARHATDVFESPDGRLDTAALVAGAATAVVVGAGEPVHTDRDARIRIQQHWQRGTDASHRLAHPDGTEEAPASPASHTFARVGQWLAGANWGSVLIPRVGQEVVLTHLGSQLDRPVALGTLYNGSGSLGAQGNDIAVGAAGTSGNAPAWFPGSERPDSDVNGEVEGHSHDAVLSGWRSQSLPTSSQGLGGCNQVVFDASPGQGRLELAACAEPGHPTARLQLGHLLQQEGNRRLAPRGHGLDMATPDHAAMRAGAGLLFSAHARPPSTSAGQQLDSREPLRDLQAAQDLQQALATTARQHNAWLGTEPAVAGGSAEQLSAQLPIQCGLHALNASLQRLASSAASAGGESSQGSFANDGGHGSVTAWSRPDLLLAAPSGVQLVTPAQAVLTAGTHYSATAAHDINLLAQASHALAARDGLVLFTYGQASHPNKPLNETGIALHAASGTVHLSLNCGAASLTSEQSTDLGSTSANLSALSSQSVQLAASGAAIDIQSGSIELKAPAPIQVYAGMRNWTAAARNANPLWDPATSIPMQPPDDEPYSQMLDVRTLIDAPGWKE